jgi:shikimate kinase
MNHPTGSRPMHRPRAVLVGPMGASKTTVAELLAEA